MITYDLCKDFKKISPAVRSLYDVELTFFKKYPELRNSQTRNCLVNWKKKDRDADFNSTLIEIFNYICRPPALVFQECTTIIEPYDYYNHI